MLLVLVVQLSFSPESVSDLSLAEILLSILDFEVSFCDELVKGLLDLHDSNYF
jgi:hypothetical protein